jgi:osmotically-inducible protein OsmY
MLQTASDIEMELTSTFEVRESNPASLVAARLRRSGHPYLYGVKCQALDGAMVLSGTVPTFHLKQVAHALALHTPGVHRVENRLEVTSESWSRFAATKET